MTSKSTSGRQQIAWTCQCGVMFGSRFLGNGSIDFENGYSFGRGNSRASSATLWCVRHVYSKTPKMEQKRTHRRVRITEMAVLCWFRFSRKLRKIATVKLTQGIYNFARKEIISYIRSAANRVNATTASPFSPSKIDFLGISWKVLKLALLKFSAMYPWKIFIFGP